MSVLVSGFGPWGWIDENPTALALARLDAVPGLATLLLPVDTARLAPLVADALDHHRPALWLGLGLAYGSATIAVERVALNIRDFAEPDAVGATASGPVVPEAPAALLANAPVRAIRDRLLHAGIPARLSESAGTFLCNQLFFTVLHAAARQGANLRVGFLHVPAHPALVARQSGRLAEAPSMAVEAVAKAVRLAVEVATAHRDPPLASPDQSRYTLG